MTSLYTAAASLRKQIHRIKSSSAHSDINWNRYDSFPSLKLLDELLLTTGLALPELVRHYPIIDAGCGDGDLSFFLEQQGFKVTALDNPSTGSARMASIHVLEKELSSNISIVAGDLDGDFSVPGRRYGLALLLGVLYHLKNPFRVLEKLSRLADYCFLSTRVIDSISGHRLPSGTPVAYLVGDTELNNDCTNYWLFTTECLHRLFERSGWTDLARIRTGAREADQRDADGREFYLLASRHYVLSSELASVRLLDGWHEVEARCYRWTAGQFSIEVRRHESTKRPSVALALTFYLPPELFQHSPVVTIDCFHENSRLLRGTFERPGIHTLRIPLNSIHVDPLYLCFSVTPCLPSGIDDKRELALQFVFSDSDERSLKVVAH